MKACKDCKHYRPWNRCARYLVVGGEDFFNGGARNNPPSIYKARRDDGPCGLDARGFEEASWWRRATVGVRELLHDGGYEP